MKRKSVFECMEEAVQCGRKASKAATEDYARDQLRLAATWLEIAHFRLRNNDVVLSGQIQSIRVRLAKVISKKKTELW
jgi:hypothetical protein